MSDASFEADWLTLREPVDHRSRAEALTKRVAFEGEDRGWSRVLDLGTGTGSNVRYLDPRLSWIRRWSVVDHDPSLLARVQEPRAGRSLERIPGDLGAEGLAAVPEADLVTASALLDLVSESWMRRLVDACRSSGAGALFTLSYDGRTAWSPPEPGDDEIRAAVNRHQERDKGLGSALGPSATAVAEGLFREAGYHVETAPSPWVLDTPGDARLAVELTEGWARAAAEVVASQEGNEGGAGAAGRAGTGSLGQGAPGWVADWLRRRRDRIAGGAFRVEVGHLDLLALPGR